MTLLGAALLALAVGVLTAPPRRSPPVRPWWAVAHGWVVGLAHRTPRRARVPDGEVAALVTEVAARLRAGADTESAWATALRRTPWSPGGRSVRVLGPDGVPVALAEDHRGPTRGAVAGVVAACRLTHRLGAPLAPVLEQCAHGIAQAEEADRARAVALAGPRSTARLLAGLPVLGVLLGVAVGTDPLTVLLDGGLGTASLLAAVVLMALGQLWTRRLVRAAQQGASR